MAEVSSGEFTRATSTVSPASALRDAVGRVLGPRGSMVLPNYVVGLAPQPVKRLAERYFDFPIRGLIRSRGILFIRVPRTASVGLSLAVYGQVIGIPHRTAIFYKKSDPALFERVLKFAVVRHPTERLVSAYNFLKEDGSDLARPNATTRRTVARFKTFEQFFSEYVKPNARRLSTLDPVVHSQSSYVCDQSGKQIVENIFRLEQMNILLGFLSNLGISDLERCNATRSRSASISPQLEKEIFDVYGQDAELFGYHPGDRTIVA